MCMTFKTKALMALAGLALAPAVFAAAVSIPAGPDLPSAAAGLDLVAGRDTAATADAVRPALAGKADPAEAGRAVLADTPITSGNTNTTSTPANADSVSTVYKDLVKSSGAQDAYQNLSADLSLDKARQVLDAGSDEDLNAARRARADADASAGMRTSGQVRTEEQIRQDEARASILAAQLLDEVAPWVGGAVALYVTLKIARYVLLRSREKASRRRRHRRSTARSR
jgi:hypothetical protein